MALAPIPTVTNIPSPPIRGTDTGTDFSNKTAATLDGLHENTIPEWNASVDAVNALLPTIEAGAEAADDAEAARDLAQGYASTATTQAGTATTQAGIATTQAGIATTQAGLAATAKTDAETARDVAIGAGPLPAQAGNAGKVLFTDGTNAFWDIARFTQLATTTTGGVAQWDFTSIPQNYSDLALRIAMTPSNSTTFNIAFDHGDGFGTAVTLASVGANAQKGGVFIPGYHLDGGILTGGSRASASEGLSISTVADAVWSDETGKARGIVGIRLSLSAGTASSVSIQLYRR